MDARAVLLDAFGRIDETLRDVADGLDARALADRPGAEANPISWLLWHLTRIQDDHLAGLSGGTQAWERWRDRFDLPLEDHDTGYGHTSDQVASVRVDDPDLLTGYHADVHELTLTYLRLADAEELDRVVDERWDPPVTAGVRLVSVLGDCWEHLGQAAYVRGLLGR